jgi:ribosomal protein S18 acetylase RimI-like enzyme
LVEDRYVKYAYRTIGIEFDFWNIPSLLAYTKSIFNNEVHYYILLICTKPKYKNMGYASSLLDDFITHIKNKSKTDIPVKIILSSIVESVTYYEKYGFKWNRKNITEYPCLLNYEVYEPGKEYFMMELDI